jgi:hypothetical protein
MVSQAHSMRLNRFLTLCLCFASWYYKIDTNQFCYVSGGQSQVSNSPAMYGTFRMPAPNQNNASRTNAAGAIDIRAGRFYVVNGITSAATSLTDVWQLDMTTGLWSWIEGSTTQADAVGAYPSGMGTANAMRVAYGAGAGIRSAWTDQSGGLWSDARGLSA